MDVGSGSLDDPETWRIHWQGFMVIHPRNRHDMPLFMDIGCEPKNHAEAHDQKSHWTKIRLTFDEDKVVIEAQYKNLKNNPNSSMIDNPY